MIYVSNKFNQMITAPVRTIKAKVELFNGSTLAATYTSDDILINISIDRVGESSKFFGFGICQRANIHLIDMHHVLNISTANSLKIYLGVDGEYSTFPTFYVSEVHRDKKTGELSITAYDRIYEATEHIYSELLLEVPYRVSDIAIACADLLGITVNIDSLGLDEFITTYDNGANFEGIEDIREILNDIAEATQTIYYLNDNNELFFKRLDRDGEAVYNIDSNLFFELDTSDNRRLSSICHATELGDNISASLPESGTTQYVRDNPFWNLRADITNIVEDALANIGGLTINQFYCKWRGNPTLEIGDKIKLTSNRGNVTYSYLLNDSIEYDGTLSQITTWEYIADTNTATSNPSTLGDMVKYTSAKVDKVNKQIDLLVYEDSINASRLSTLELTTDDITARVESVEKGSEAVNTEINEIKKQVEASITSEDVTIAINSALESGVDKVETTTGYKFNQDGLTVSKSGSEMTTTITDDGMTVYKSGNEVLTANNEGVKAIDLHAETFLIIGKNSRLEDYKSNRTACFYMG